MQNSPRQNVIFARLSRALSRVRAQVYKVCVGGGVLRQLSEAKRKVKYIGGGSLHTNGIIAQEKSSREAASLSLSLSGYFRSEHHRRRHPCYTNV